MSLKKSDTQKAFDILNVRNVWPPVLLGLGFVIYLFVYDEAFTVSSISFINQARIPYLLLGLATMVVHDFTYMYRIRAITQDKLSWLSSLYIIILWGFSSSVTPSVVGGGLVAIFLLAQEGIKPGKALAYVMLTVILDNFFLALTAPIGYWFAYEAIVTVGGSTPLQGSLSYIFWTGYTLVTIYTLAMIFALFVQPKAFKWILLQCTSIGFLKRWREAANTHGDEIIMASKILRGNTSAYWIKVTLSSVVAWAARFVMLNVIITAYFPINFAEHIVVFSKHLVLWIVMIVSPTPGSSGAAEFFFQQLYQGLLGEYTLAVDLIWRILTYYLYLILGAICLPRWLKYVMAKQQHLKAQKTPKKSHPGPRSNAQEE